MSKRADTQSPCAESSGHSSEEEDVKMETTSKEKGNFDELERLRREKRLAMNRESARARRKRKKVLLESLESRVEEMNERNQRLRLSNETLRTQVTHLENELATARSTIALLTQARSSSLLSSGAAAGGLSAGGLGAESLASIMLKEKTALQQEAAWSVFPGIPVVPNGSLGGEQSAMDYLQLLSLAKSQEKTQSQNVLAGERALLSLQ